MTIPEEVKDIAQEIGQYYLKKNDGNYELAGDDIRKLCISEIRVSNVLSSKGVESREITIVTPYPGILIGRRGSNIDELAKHLMAQIKVVEEENALINYLVPYEVY